MPCTLCIKVKRAQRCAHTCVQPENTPKGEVPADACFHEYNSPAKYMIRKHKRDAFFCDINFAACLHEFHRQTSLGHKHCWCILSDQRCASPRSHITRSCLSTRSTQIQGIDFEQAVVIYSSNTSSKQNQTNMGMYFYQIYESMLTYLSGNVFIIRLSRKGLKSITSMRQGLIRPNSKA